jgi:hypothetical protein
MSVGVALAESPVIDLQERCDAVTLKYVNEQMLSSHITCIGWAIPAPPEAFHWKGSSRPPSCGEAQRYLGSRGYDRHHTTGHRLRAVLQGVRSREPRALIVTGGEGAETDEVIHLDALSGAVISGGHRTLH